MKYISMLRGINVGGHKKVKMTDLKTLYESLGFENIVTYIQSGNVVFNTDIEDILSLKTSLEKAIQEKYQFHVPVIIRTHNDIKSLIENCPISSIDLQADGAKFLVTFLSDKPLESNTSVIQDYVQPSEEIWIKEKEIYLYCPKGYGTSKLSNTLFEKKLAVQATTRNWKTIQRLYELSI